MKLLDFVVRESIIVDLQATGKEQAIREMVGSLHRAGRLANDDVESVIRAILGREELGSTGIGQGVAVPHTRHPTLQSPGRDGRPVAPWRRFRGAGRRAGRHLLPAGLAPEPARRPSQGVGEYFTTLERRAIRQFPASGPVARERGRSAGGSRSPRAVTRESRGPLAVAERVRSTGCWPDQATVAGHDRPERQPCRDGPLIRNCGFAAARSAGDQWQRRRPSQTYVRRKRPPEGFVESESSPVVACPRPRPIEPPMSHDTTVARRQVEVTNSLGLHCGPPTSSSSSHSSSSPRFACFTTATSSTARAFSI